MSIANDTKLKLNVVIVNLQITIYFLNFEAKFEITPQGPNTI